MQQARKTLLVTLAVSLISVSGIALPYPILAPLFIELQHPLASFAGLPPKLLLGISLAIYPLGILVGSNIIGSWSDRIGRKKALAITMFGAVLGYLLSAFAVMQGSFVLFCLSRLLTGLCEGNLSIARAIAADLHPTIDRTRAFSLLSATSYAGYLVGPLIGGFLLPMGAELAFAVAALACLISVVMIVVMLPADKPTASEGSSHSLSLIRLPTIKPFFYMYLALMLALNGFYEFYPVLQVEMLGFNSMQIAWSTVIITASMIIAATLLVMPIKRRFGMASTACLSMFVYAIALLCFTLLPQFYLVTFIVIGASIALFNAMLPSYLSELGSDGGGQGQLMGLMTTTFCIGNVAMAIIGSLLALIDTRLALAGSALLGLIATWQFYKHHYQRTLWREHISSQITEQ
ncbi:MFS transporter [Ferrimonas lipolytica]|uniref:MFS transporter n=1 Tax=Ferrimonas lipolytica TaxID=2724191 RepID=A0A6H1UB22_9GAMM|nr:MFS transporter [Ferrimonas lipolytica]QIZ75839.1 MFS transporter [Ferrimonas lipolytica]